ncbi:MAG: MarR family winged helix-turn-helix transcriptional regulator [Casimicrobiaceae bacterium]
MLTDKEFRTLAAFRHSLRQFQFYSEQSSRAVGLTAQQYQALLVIKGHDDIHPFTVKVLAQFLMIKHNSAVELVDRIAELGLVERKHTEPDRRRVVIELTPHGRQMLRRLVSMHRRELHRVAPEFTRYFRHFARSATGDE